jgi:hypothetical protein
LHYLLRVLNLNELDGKDTNCSGDMFVRSLTRGFNKESTIVFALLFNAFSWYFIGSSVIRKIDANDPMLEIAFLSSIIVSGLLGSVLLAKIARNRILLAWTVEGAVVPFCLMISQHPLIPIKLMTVILFGSSIGIGMPSLLAFFAVSLPIENRGKISGLVFFWTILSASLFTIIIPQLSIELSVAILSVWKLWSLPLVIPLFRRITDLKFDRPEIASFKRVIYNRNMALYLAAWLLFTLVDGFGASTVGNHIEQFSNGFRVVELAVASLSALGGGIICDWIGRKKVIMFGFVSLGIGYAAVGLTPTAALSWLLFIVVDGIAIGSLWTMFTVVLWGEIDTQGSEKYYALGEIPYFLTGIVSTGLSSYTSAIPEASTFSLAALFLFVAVVPLMYAFETLPEKKMKQRDLKMYIEKAHEVKQKYE